MTTVNHVTGEVLGDPETLGPLDRYGPLEDIDPRRAAMIMVRVQRLRRDQAKEVLRLRKEAARLTAIAEKAKARGQLSAEGTVEDRKAQGRLTAADAFFDVACAEACRSIGANERAEKNAIEGVGN